MQALTFATKLLDAAEAKSTGGKKRKAAAGLAEALHDVRERIKAIVAAPNPQVFVAGGCKPPVAQATTSQFVSQAVIKPAPAPNAPIGSRIVIDADDIKLIMGQPAGPSRQAAVQALTRHKGDVRRPWLARRLIESSSARPWPTSSRPRRLSTMSRRCTSAPWNVCCRSLDLAQTTT